MFARKTFGGVMRQFFLLSVLFFFVQISAAADQGLLGQSSFANGQVVLESNDAGESVIMTQQQYAELTGQNFMVHLASFFNFKKTFAEVASYITPTLESEFDVFIIINVDWEERFNGTHEIPAQYMKVVRRTQEGQPIFNRDASGKVMSVRNDVLGNNGDPAFSALDSYLMPISSGAGGRAADPQPYVDTPTGIYRINWTKSDRRRYGTGMYHSLYFDLLYPHEGNRESGLAVHGTGQGNYDLLGSQQSHGCVRTTQAVANDLYENLVNGYYESPKEFWSEELPDMTRTHRLKSENGSTRAGSTGLIILFYGYGSNGSVGV